MELKRKIRLFFVAYGRLLFEVMGIILLVVLFLQWLDKQVEERHKIEYSNEIKFEQEDTISQKEIDKSNKDKECISRFIECCMSGNVQEAYSMLSEKCKQKKYSTIDIFKTNYINKTFSIKFYDYTIYFTDDGTYMVKLQENLLNTGGTEITQELKIGVVEEILGKKVEIID